MATSPVGMAVSAVSVVAEGSVVSAGIFFLLPLDKAETAMRMTAATAIPPMIK